MVSDRLKKCVVPLFIAISLSWLQITYSLPTKFEDVENWQAPDYLIESFPYFLSGFDEDNTPVWIVNYGRWDFFTLMNEETPNVIAEFDKYVTLMFKRMYNSPKEASARGAPVEEFIVIDDLEGYNNKQLIHRKTVTKQLELFQAFFHLEKTRGPALKRGFGVNLNFPARSIWSLIKPQLGDVAFKVEVFGTNSNKWKMNLLKDIPAEALPPWLGGKNETWASIQNFGTKKIEINKFKTIVLKD